MKPKTAQPTLRSFGRIAPSPDWRMVLHRHDYHELIIVFDGLLHVKDDKSVGLVARAGDMLVYPAGRRHDESSDRHNPVELVFFAFNGEVANTNNIELYSDSDGRIRSLAQWIIGTRHEKTADNYHQTLFAAILSELHRLQTVGPENSLAKQVRDYTVANLDKQITLAALAHHVNFSKYHFLREYKKAAGVAPMAEVRRLRLAEAKNLLTTTNLPLKAIAPMVGMANEYQLSTSLRKYLGGSAKKIRGR